MFNFLICLFRSTWLKKIWSNPSLWKIPTKSSYCIRFWNSLFLWCMYSYCQNNKLHSNSPASVSLFLPNSVGTGHGLMNFLLQLRICPQFFFPLLHSKGFQLLFQVNGVSACHWCLQLPFSWHKSFAVPWGSPTVPHFCKVHSWIPTPSVLTSVLFWGALISQFLKLPLRNLHHCHGPHGDKFEQLLLGWTSGWHAVQTHVSNYLYMSYVRTLLGKGPEKIILKLLLLLTLNIPERIRGSLSEYCWGS